MAQATREHHTVLIGQMVLLLQQIITRQTSSPRSGPGMPIRFMETMADISKKIDLVHKLYRLWVWSRLVRWPAFAYGALKYIGWA